MNLVRRWIPVLVASVVGVVVLLGSLFRANVWLVQARDLLVDWAIVLAGFALLLGILNILSVHGGRVVRVRKGWGYSLVLLGSATGLALVTAIQGPSAASTQVLVDMLIVPVGTALAALVLFVLVGAVFRMLRVRRDAASLLFLAVAVIVLLVSTPLVGWEWLAQPLRDWFLNVLSLAGMRGLVLGVALGTVITALRALLLGDWPRERRNVGGK